MPQRMAIEWKHVDVALFDKLPRNDKNTCVVVEAKKCLLHAFPPSHRLYHTLKISRLATV